MRHASGTTTPPFPQMTLPLVQRYNYFSERTTIHISFFTSFARPFFRAVRKAQVYPETGRILLYCLKYLLVVVVHVTT